MKKTVFLVLTLVCAAVLLCGCSGNADTLASPTPGNNGLLNNLIPGTTDGSGSMLNPQSPGPDTTLMPDQSGDTVASGGMASPEDVRKASEEMEDAVGKLSEIDDAYVIAMENQALVGVKLNEQYQGQVDDRVKKMVLSRVQTVNKNVTGVAVTADAAQVQEIEALSKTLDTASSLSDVSQQAQELIKQISVYQE